MGNFGGAPADYFDRFAQFDDIAWADRNEHWLAQNASTRGRKGRRDRVNAPLILCGRGVKLKIDKGTLLVSDGFTHYPQERKTYRFFRGDLNVPPRIIVLDASGGLSFEVIKWLSEQNVPLIQIDYQGDVVSVVGGYGYAIDLAKVQWQIEMRNDPDKRLHFSRELIAEKLKNSLGTLRNVIPQSRGQSVAINHTEAALYRLQYGPVGSIEELRMIEAGAAAHYFKCWTGLPLIWRYKWKYPVPDAWLTIGSRGTTQRGRSITNRNAKHPVNAILNYAYGLLYSQVHIEAVASGFDPRRGVMHQDRDDKDAFAWVFDMVEPRRPIVDAAILKFVLTTPFRAVDFVVREDGVCRTAPQLARTLTQAVYVCN